MFNAILKSKVTNNQGIMKRSIYLLLVGMFLLYSCYEEPLTKGVITVYDSNGNTIEGVEVTLSQEDMGPGVTQTNIVDIQTSDYKGQTEHILEMESIMNVTALLIESSNDTILFGQTVIRFIQGEVVYKDVEVIAY